MLFSSSASNGVSTGRSGSFRIVKVRRKLQLSNSAVLFEENKKNQEKITYSRSFDDLKNSYLKKRTRSHSENDNNKEVSLLLDDNNNNKEEEEEKSYEEDDDNNNNNNNEMKSKSDDGDNDDENIYNNNNKTKSIKQIDNDDNFNDYDDDNDDSDDDNDSNDDDSNDNNKNARENTFIRISSKKNLASNMQKLEFHFFGTQSVKNERKNYTVYYMQIDCYGNHWGQKRVMRYKRFREFYTLHKLLVTKLKKKSFKLPKFPKKKMLKKMEKNFIEQRQFLLELYMNELGRIPEVLLLHEFLDFLQLAY